MDSQFIQITISNVCMRLIVVKKKICFLFDVLADRRRAFLGAKRRRQDQRIVTAN